MNSFHRKRFHLISGSGPLLVNTDVHGNGEDFFRLRDIYLDLLAADQRAQWVILGDIVHAPNAQARVDRPDLYDYDDDSWAIAEAVLDLQSRHEDRVHFVLGNHDHAHIGGQKTRKFYDDEAAALEAKLGVDEIERLHTLFHTAYLVIATSCGATLTHGAPGIALDSLKELDEIPLYESRCSPRQRLILENILRSYGQPTDDARLFLDSLTRQTGVAQRFVIHGHDRDEEGFFVENHNQLCPCIFGAPRAEKRYVLLDLDHSYKNIQALLAANTLRHLYS